MPIIDLQALTEETLDFKWLDGQILHVPQPTMRFVRKVQRADNIVENAQALVLEYLVGNKEGRKLTAEDVAELNKSQQEAVLLAVLGFVQEVDENPNS